MTWREYGTRVPPPESTLSVAALKRDFAALVKQPADAAAQAAFIKRLISTHSPAVLDLHYRFLAERSLPDGLFRALRTSFSKRGPEGEDYLLERLPKERDPALQGDVLQMLGSYRYSGGKRLDETAAWARRLVRSEADTLVCRALWVLGWVGAPDDVAVLSEVLFDAASAENRGWAATALMQLAGTHPEVTAPAIAVLGRAIRVERGERALENMLISLQELTGQRLGLKASSHEPASSAKVQAALKKALKLVPG